MNISVTVDSRQLQAAFNKAPATVTLHMNRWIRKSAARVEREAKTIHLDHVDEGRLQSSITTSFGHLQATVRPTAKHAKFVHAGRKPGSKMPPYGERSSLGKWAKKRGIEPFVVARSIARNGIEADPFMQEAYDSVKPKAERDGEQVLKDIVRSI